MTKKITLKNSKVLGLFLVLLGLLGSSSYNLSHAQAPYCSVSHSASGCPTYNMYIGKIRISQGSNILFDKADDGCNQTAVPNYTQMSSSPSFTLSGGSNYTISFSTGTTYAEYMGVWIDLDQDLNFSSAEFFSTGWGQVATGGGLTSFSLPIGCSGLKPGNTRMRVRSQYYGSGAWSSGQACATVNYGETEDYTIKLATSTSLAAGFYMPSQAYVSTLVKMTNNNQSGYIGHQWDVDDNGSIEYTTINASTIFTTTGTKCIRLKSQNCLGRDSVLKCINIVNPTSKPVVDFAVVANEIERFGTANFLDLTTNGPDYWSWYMYDPIDSAATRMDVESLNSNLVGNNPYQNQNPAVFFNRTGNYTVCMQASNNQGPSNLLCKPNYLRVTPFKDNPLGAGTVQPIYEQSGNIMDDGGRNGNYSNNRIDYATIIPCGAETITLKFAQCKLATGDLLKVYDGVNANGKPLHPGTGFTLGVVPTTPLVAKSGAMYLYFSTNGSGTDSGFLASWTTKRGPIVAPIADFIIPDTLYNPVNYTYTNTSQNVLGNTSWIWSVDPGYGEVAYTKDLIDFGILTDNTYDVSLEATTCMGYSKYTKSVVVVTPHTQTNLDITSSNRRPNTGETVFLSAISSIPNKALKADNFKWSFFPNTVSFVGSTNSGSRDPKVTFNAKGKYTVSLTAWNTLDPSATTATVIKSDYVIVVEHCTPLLGISSSSDIAINNVTLEDANANKLIDNTSGNNLQGYDDYTSTNISANVAFGGTYKITTSRVTNINPMSRKVWIDWNIDGDFDDAGELVASEATAKTASFSATFKVPTITTSFEGRTKMRIGTSYSSDPNQPCGASSGVTNANRLGEFEDYRIVLVNDYTAPTLTLNNKDTLYLEVGSTYNEYGAKAIDATEGDISSLVTITSDLDMSFTGIYYLTYNVTDAGGNKALPKTRVVYVVRDQNKPVITLNGNDTVRVEVFSAYTEDGATAMDNKDGNITNSISVSGTVNSNVIGTYTLTYLVIDQAGNKATKNRVVIVKDSQKPVISNSDADVNNIVKVQILSIFIDRTKVTDNYDNPIALNVTKGPATPDGVDTRFKGTYTLIYNSTDVSGNQAIAKTYKYVVDDYVGPNVVLNTLDTIIHPVNKAYNPVQATAYDNYYDNSQVSITRTSNVIFYKTGLYWDEFTATDGSGNITIRRRYVRVIDDIAPVLNGLPLNVGLWSTVDASEGLTITDNYDAPTALRPRLKVLFNNLNTYIEGVYAVTYEVTDFSGNVSLPFNHIINVNRAYPTIQGNVSNIGKDKTINVYPNPSTGIVNVSYNFATPENMEVNVYNATGVLVSSISNIHGQSGVQSIDLSNEANGLYFVRMTVSGKQISRTISLNK